MELPGNMQHENVYALDDYSFRSNLDLKRLKKGLICPYSIYFFFNCTGNIIFFVILVSVFFNRGCSYRALLGIGSV